MSQPSYVGNPYTKRQGMIVGVEHPIILWPGGVYRIQTKGVETRRQLMALNETSVTWRRVDDDSLEELPISGYEKSWLVMTT